MKKIMPVFLTLIMIICSFSACENKTNPLDKFDSITAYSTIDELKAIFDGCEIKDETETSFTVIDDNSVLQPLAEKYGVTVNTEIEITGRYSYDHKEVLFIDIDLTTPSVTKNDMKTIMDQLTQKYGKFEDDSSNDPNSFRYKIYTENGYVRFNGYVGESITIKYMFR